MFANIKKNNLHVFLMCLSTMYFIGVLSYRHTFMDRMDMYMGLFITPLLCLGLIVWYYHNAIKKIGISSLTWLLLLPVIVLQPFINDVIYADALIFPFGSVLIALLVSIVGVHIDNHQRTWIIKNTAWLFLIIGILTVVTQFIQLFLPNHTLPFIAPITNRLYSNLAQPNQASFVAVLAITSAVYLFFLNPKNKLLALILSLSVLFLSIGVSFSTSRAGLVLLAFALVGMGFYGWQSHKLRAGVMIGVLAIFAVGYQLGNALMAKFFVSFTGADGVGRLVSEGAGLRPILYERAFSAFKDEPITGIGYANYLSHGLDNIEKWYWFEHANHAHNVLTHIGAEFGILGLVPLLGVLFVLFRQVYLFVTFKLSQEKYFICLLLLSFVLYSFSEFPLWYVRYLFVFAFLVALLDDGFEFNNLVLNKVVAILSAVVLTLSAFYFWAYNHYLHRYEVVMYQQVGNQEKIDAYQSTPTIFGFSKFKEEMLHMVADEEGNDPERLLAIGDRLIRHGGSLDVMRVQVRLLLKTGQTEQVDKIHRTVCIIEHQQQIISGLPRNNCEHTLVDVRAIDPNDEMGYAKRLIDWYQKRYPQ